MSVCACVQCVIVCSCCMHTYIHIVVADCQFQARSEAPTNNTITVGLGSLLTFALIPFSLLVVPQPSLVCRLQHGVMAREAAS